MINNHKIVESSRAVVPKGLCSQGSAVANKHEFILGTISIIGIVVYEESDLLTFRFALATTLTTFSGFSASLLHWPSFQAYFLTL